MDQEWLQEQVDSLKLDELIELTDIPNIDLYMDQLITLFEDKLSHTKRSEDDKLLTKTMINNYTKDKVLMPAVKKKYTKDHIILMVLLYQLKSIISISDIKDVFTIIKDEDHLNHDKLVSIYNAYLSCREKEIGYFNLGVEKRVETINDQMAEVGIEDEEIESVLLVFSLIQQAAYHKRLAEKIIDERIKKHYTKIK